MTRVATHGVVSIAALDLRVRPDHRAELGSQLLLGEVVELVGGARAGWRRVCSCTDGYRGWVRAWGFVPCSAARARRWQALASARLAVPLASIVAEPGSTAGVGPAFLGARLIAGRARRGWRPVELPDARRGWLPSASLRLAGDRIAPLEERVRSLLGAPYLWGGRTPAGLDCSAFVQLVLAEQGVALPRDAHHQWRSSHPLAAGAAPAAGDLAFFSTAPAARRSHVGIALGGMYFAHCRGLVRIQSLEPGSPLHAADLAPQFRGWARPRAIPVLPGLPRIGSRQGENRLDRGGARS